MRLETSPPCLSLQAFAEVDRTDTNGATPLDAACSSGHVDVARLLVPSAQSIGCHSEGQDDPKAIQTLSHEVLKPRPGASQNS